MRVGSATEADCVAHSGSEESVENHSMRFAITVPSLLALIF